jgi:hypothetical protein
MRIHAVRLRNPAYGNIIPCMLCCGSGMFIPDPNFCISDPGSRGEKIPDPEKKIKKVYLSHKSVTELSEM